MIPAPAQLSLEDEPLAPEPWKARADDPVTSHEADRSMTGAVLRDQQALVLATVAKIASPFNSHCASAYDVSERLHAEGQAIQQNVAAKRLTELAEAGMVEATGIERPGSSSRPCRCFALTEDGEAWLGQRRAS